MKIEPRPKYIIKITDRQTCLFCYLSIHEERWGHMVVSHHTFASYFHEKSSAQTVLDSISKLYRVSLKYELVSTVHEMEEEFDIVEVGKPFVAWIWQCDRDLAKYRRMSRAMAISQMQPEQADLVIVDEPNVISGKA